ncbi:helix-turn-helix domain-containing protein [Amycolatopsis lurida]
MPGSTSADDGLTLGEWLRHRRNETQKSLSVVGGLAGVSGTVVSNVERGRREESIVASLCLLFRLVDVLEAPREEVVARLVREAEKQEPRVTRREVTVWSARK